VRRRLGPRGWTILAAALFVLVVVAYAWKVEPNHVIVEEIEVPVPGLAPELESIRVVFLADLHVRRAGPLEIGTIERMREMEPDLLLIGGDLITVPYYMVDVVHRTAVACSLLAAVDPPLGKFLVWGNNDYPEAMTGLVEDAGITILSNEWTTVRYQGKELVLLGLDDPVTGRSSWPDLMSPRPSGPGLLMAHSPDAYRGAVERGMPVMLAGHTHGGQILHPFIGLDPTRFLGLLPGTPAYRAGFYREGASVLYVSRGIGTSYFPFRFLCPPEITLVHLRRAAER